MLAVKDASTSCEVFQVTANPSIAGQIDRADAAAGWNPAGFPTAVYGNGDGLVNLGTLRDNTYSISAKNTLQQTAFALAPANSQPAYTTPPLDLFPNIVAMVAFYGKDTNGDGVVDTYDQATPTTNAGWMQVLTVRVAIVARSAQYEKLDDRNNPVTTASPKWDIGAITTVPKDTSNQPVDCGTSKCLTLKLDALPDWQRYRYKVYDTVIPLRNLLWHS